jgi:hypothetical protein
MHRSYRIALACGLIPLLTGTLIFITWLGTRWQWLEMAGLFTLLLGPFFILAGMGNLFRFHWLTAAGGTVTRRQRWLRSLLCTGLFGFNFVAAAGILRSVDSVMTQDLVDQD